MRSGLLIALLLPLAAMAGQLPPGITSVTSGTTDGVNWTASWLPFALPGQTTGGDYLVGFDQNISAYELTVSFPDGSDANTASAAPPGLPGFGCAFYSPDHASETLCAGYGSAVVSSLVVPLQFSNSPGFVPHIQFTSIRATAVPEPSTLVLAGSIGILCLLIGQGHHNGLIFGRRRLP